MAKSREKEVRGLIEQALQAGSLTMPKPKPVVAPPRPPTISKAREVEGTRPVDISASVGGMDPDLAWIIQKESSGRTTAKNPKSSAFGLGQLISANRQFYAKRLGIADPNTTDYNEQLRMMQTYIKERYGSPKAARDFWQRKGYY